MIEWWNTLALDMKLLWGITLTVSLIFVIQSIMTFLGVDSDSDFDINTDAGGADLAGEVNVAADGTADTSTGMGLLTFRNFVNFFLGFGWSAILLRGAVESTALLMIVSVVVGIGLVFAVMMLYKWLAGMQQSGNINVFEQAADCEGRVYLSIPAARSGEGKVQVTINNSVREYAAVTDGEALPTGTSIRVVEAVGAGTLLVERIDSIII